MSEVLFEFRNKNRILALVQLGEEGQILGEVEIRYGERVHPIHRYRKTGFVSRDELEKALESLKSCKPSEGPQGTRTGSPKPSRVSTKGGPGGGSGGDGDGGSSGPDDSVLSQ